MNQRATHIFVVAVIVVSMLSFTGVWALFSRTFRISNYATIKTVGVEVYWDSSLTQLVTSIDWGKLEPNENKTVRIYIKSIANVPSTLALSTENWIPSNASLFMRLSWNYNDIVLNPGDVLPVDLTLSVSPSITGITNFSFDIIITAQA